MGISGRAPPSHEPIRIAPERVKSSHGLENIVFMSHFFLLIRFLLSTWAGGIYTLPFPLSKRSWFRVLPAFSFFDSDPRGGPPVIVYVEAVALFFSFFLSHAGVQQISENGCKGSKIEYGVFMGYVQLGSKVRPGFAVKCHRW